MEDSSRNHLIDEINLNVASLVEVNKFFQQSQDILKTTPHHQELSTTFQNLIAQEQGPWNIIIVNYIPKFAVREEIISLFSEYGAITDVYLPEERLYSSCHRSYRPQHKGFAQITFKNEGDARRVWEVFLEKGIKYNDHSGSDGIIITLASQNYTPIENLSDDCLREIFLHVYSLKHKIVLDIVCKRWRKVARQSWSNITKVQAWESCDCPWKVTLERAGHYLRMIQINLSEDTAKLLSLLIEYCENLEELEITLPDNFVLFLPQLNVFLRMNERLRCLSIKFEGRPCYFYDYDRPAIRFLDISSMQHVPATLEEMHLKGSNEVVHLLAPLELSRFQNLQVLEILDIKIRRNDLRGIETLENLKKLKLHDCNVHPSNIERIISLTKLEYLSIAKCQITDSILSEILENNKGLRYLNISGIREITDSSFMCVQQLPELRVLSMNDVPLITDSYLCRMPKLRALACNDCPITGDGLAEFLKTASSIEKIFLYNCPLSVKSIENARKWTQRTSRRLKLFLNDLLALEYDRKMRNRDEGSLDIECHEVACTEEDPMMHDWADDLH